MRYILINKQANFDYKILFTVEAGIVLEGWQASQIRRNKCHFEAPYVVFDPVPVLKGLNVTVPNGSFVSPTDSVKLLLHSWEIRQLKQKVTQKGLTVVPLKLFYPDGEHRVKLTLGLAKGKKQYEKIDTIKQRDLEREAKQWK